MRFKIQVVIDDDDQQEAIEEIITLEKPAEHIDQVGLTLAESKEILKGIQRTVVEQQGTEYVERHRTCPDCGKRRSRKGHHEVVFRSLFGNVHLRSPRLYPPGSTIAPVATRPVTGSPSALWPH